jgi:hypothetical protein
MIADDGQIPPDGHCMYTAIADQLAEIGMVPAHQVSSSLAQRVLPLSSR